MYLILQLLFILFQVSNFFVLFPSQFEILNSIFSLFFLLILPGMLLILAFEYKKPSFWEGLSLVIGLSVSLLLIVGLVINFLLPIFNILPLSKLPVLISIDLVLIVLFIINFFKYKTPRAGAKFGKILANGVKTIQNIKIIDVVSLVSAFSFPVLAIVGALNLNNGGGNIFTMIQLGGIGVYLLYITLVRNKIAEYVYPGAIFFIALSLLLMTSMRGWYITGHDVQFEYYIFHLTKAQQFWSINFYKDAYNACLSITVLPTMLANFFSFNDVYIYKIIFQIIFAFCPVVVYLLMKKYANSFLAFAATFYFLTFPTFLNDMPMLNRQEIAFLFFSLMLYILLLKEKIKYRLPLLAFFSFGVVTSHYSTNYITTASLAVTYIAFHILQIKKARKFFLKIPILKYTIEELYKFKHRKFIPLSLLLLLFGLTLFWNGLLTKTSGDLFRTAGNAVTNIGSIFKEDNKSVDIAYSLFSTKKVSDKEYLKEQIDKWIERANSDNLGGFYDEKLTSNYSPEIIENKLLPRTGLGEMLKNIGIDNFSLNYNLRQLLAKTIQGLIIVGLIWMQFKKGKNKYDAEYILMSLVSVFMILMMIVLPGVSVNYGLLRLFQQFLVLLGLPAVLGSVLIFSKFKRAKMPYLISGILIIFFLNLSGFISEITGGYYPQFNLRNEGIYYDAYYVYASESASMDWLSRVMPKNATVQSDRLSRDKLLAYGKIATIDGSIPQTFRQSAYVYASYLNITGKTVVSVDRSIVVEYPIEFLDQNKNLVYNNGLSRIYK